jgi:hypothetical protein
MSPRANSGTTSTRASSSSSTKAATMNRRAAAEAAAALARASSSNAVKAGADAATVTRRRSASSSSSSASSPKPTALDPRPSAIPSPTARAFTDPRRFVVFSDLHLSPRTLPTCLSVLAAVRDAAAERKAGVVFLGDWWDTRGALPVEPLNAVLRELASWPSQGVSGGLVLLPGNHDQVDPLGRTHALTPLAAALGPERAHCFDEPAVWRGAVWVPYRRDPAVVRAALREAAAADGVVSAAMLHADVKGARVNAAWQARGGLDAEALFPSSGGSSPIRRVYSGHYHLPHDVDGLFPCLSPPPPTAGSRGRRSASSPPAPSPPTVTYIGSPYQVSRAEEGQRKRLLVLDAEQGWQVDEEVPLSVGRRFWTVRSVGGAAVEPSSRQQQHALDAPPTYEELLGARVREAEGGDGGVLLELPDKNSHPARTLLLRPGDCLRVEVPPPSTTTTTQPDDPSHHQAADRLRRSLSEAFIDLELVLPAPLRRTPPRIEAAESRAAAELLQSYCDSRALSEPVRTAAREVLDEASGGAAAASARPPRVELQLESVSVEGYGPFREAQHYPLSSRGMRALTGRNDDDAGATSNGAGKSSLLSAVLWAFKALGGGGGGGSGAASAGGTAAAAASSSSAAESARRRTAAEVVADGCRHARVVVRGALNGEPFELERVAVRPRAAASNGPTKKGPRLAAAPKAGTRLTLAGDNRTLEDSRATDRLVASLFATPLMARSLLLGQEELMSLLDSTDGRFKQALGALVDLDTWALAKSHASRRLQASRRESDALLGQAATMRRVAGESMRALEAEEARAGEWERARGDEVAGLRQEAARLREEVEMRHARPLRQVERVLRAAALRAEGQVAAMAAEAQRIAALDREDEQGAEEQAAGVDRHARETAAADAAREHARVAAARARADAEIKLRPRLEAALAAVASAEERAFGGAGAAASAAAAPWDEPSAAAARGQQHDNGDDQVMAVLREEAARLAEELAAAERAHAALEGERVAEARRRDALAQGVGGVLGLLVGGGGANHHASSSRSGSPARTGRRRSSSPAWPLSSRQQGQGATTGATAAARAAPLSTTTATAASDNRHHHHEHNFFNAQDGTFAPSCDRCGQPVDPEAAAAALARLDAALDELSSRCERAAAEAAEMRALVAANSAAIEREQSARREAAARLASAAAAAMGGARQSAAALEREREALLQRERDAVARADAAWAEAVRAAGERERLRREGREQRRQRADELERRAAALGVEAAAWRAAAEAAEQAADEAGLSVQEQDDDGGTSLLLDPPSSLAASVPARSAACRRASTLAADALAAADRRAADLSPHSAALEALREQRRMHESEAARAEAESSAARSRVDVLKAVDAAFGRSGVPAFVLEGVLGELQRAAEGHLRALSDTMQLELSLSCSSSAAPAAASKRGRGRGRRTGATSGDASSEAESVDSDDDGGSAAAATTAGDPAAVVKTVLVPAADGSGELVARTVAQLSGGERKRAALALALGFAQVAAARGRFRCGLLMLDEALEKLDDEGEARVLALLAGLLPRGERGDDDESAAATRSPSSSLLAYDTIILADQAAAFATHALPAVDVVVKSRGRARVDWAA